MALAFAESISDESTSVEIGNRMNYSYCFGHDAHFSIRTTPFDVLFGKNVLLRTDEVFFLQLVELKRNIKGFF